MKLDSTVVIVGAGPVGLSLALCLGRLGIGSIIVERREQPSQHPRAHYVNTRTMELFRCWGIDEAIIADAYPPDHMPFDMLAAIGGPTREEREKISPMSVISCAQDVVERELERAVVATGHTTILRATTCLGVVDHGDFVEVSIGDGDGTRSLRARWCVAADGAHSPIRKSLGIRMIGHDHLGSILNIYFHARLSPPGEVPPLGMPSGDAEIKGAFISMDGAARWCFQWIYDPAELDPATVTAEACIDAIRKAGGIAEDVMVDIRSIRPWTMTALVAERMRYGSIFLAGDAAHAFPPTGGFGMNSGIADAHNLAWKLRAVVDGIAGDALLASYEEERQPVAFFNTAQSFRNHKTQNLSGEVFDADEVAAMLAVVEPFATRSVRSAAAQEADADKRIKLEMLEHYAAIGQELGYAYDRSSIVTYDEEPRPDVTVAKYVTNASPGARAPHLLVKAGDVTVSVLDLFDGQFTLLTGKSGSSWTGELSILPEKLRFQSRMISEGELWAPVPGWSLNETYGIDDDGAVLVRPDGHVAFRARSRREGGDALRRALFRSMGIERAQT